jgi:alkanesulfonate monooxygenase SsuD/methylene tetrahydromethanopterin reductase-like flavin-dependent oxidoreductase (luciferase family)
VFLGLEVGTSRMHRDWFGIDAAHPAPRMGELIEVIRASWRTRSQCGYSSQAREMPSARSGLPDLAFAAPPTFLVGRRRRAQYDAVAIALFSQQN